MVSPTSSVAEVVGFHFFPKDFSSENEQSNICFPFPIQGLGRQFLQLGESFAELEASPAPSDFMGGNLKNMNEFGIKMNELTHEQIKEEVFHFADVILEYKNNANLKATFYSHFFLALSISSLQFTFILFNYLMLKLGLFKCKN